MEGKHTRLAVIGGFLGSGKTTAILSIAKGLVGSGMKVGIVTNDQGSDLVDTNFLVSAGFPVLEVEGGCFCCNFDEFVNKLNTLAAEQLPDVILAEPVGSCTDLVASIFRPMQMKHADSFALSPLCVLADPRRVKRMKDETEKRFQSEINYLFRKQLEEADIILLNKKDLFSAGEINDLTQYLKGSFPGTEVIAVSAKAEDGVRAVIPVITGGIREQVGELMELDYEKYGLAESFLGWFNATATLSCGDALKIKNMVCAFMENVRQKISDQGREIAHLKTYAVFAGGYLKASLTGVEDMVDVYEDNFKTGSGCSLIINARINIQPDLLEPVIAETLLDALEATDMTIQNYKCDCFTPGMPSNVARKGESTCCCCSAK